MAKHGRKHTNQLFVGPARLRQTRPRFTRRSENLYIQSHRPSNLILWTLILITLYSHAAAQTRYDQLKAWDGQYPTYNESTRKFFDIPEVRDPLRKQLPRRIYFLLTRGHTKESPIRIVRTYLKAIVCGSPGSYACDNITMLIIDLNDGSTYVAFNLHSHQPRYFASKGKFTDLPQDIQDEH